MELLSVMFLCCVLAMELTLGSGGSIQPNVGEAQRLSSLTFGCFQIRGKSPRVLTGPEPSQKSISTLLDRDPTHTDCRRPSTGQKTDMISVAVWLKVLVHNPLSLTEMQQGWEEIKKLKLLYSKDMLERSKVKVKTFTVTIFFFKWIHFF